MKRRHMILAGGVALAAAVAVFGDKTPAGGISEALVRAPDAPARPPAPAASSPSGADAPVYALAPRAAAPASPAFGAGAAPFGSQNWTPPPPPAPALQAVAPAPPPNAPPLPFTFLGKALSDGQWEVYLARGDVTLIVHVNTVIDGSYRVDAIRPPALTLTYLPLNQAQQINIGVLD